MDLDNLWDVANFAIAGVLDAAVNVFILVEVFLDKLDSTDGIAHYIIGGVGGFFFATLMASYYLSYLQMHKKEEWAEILRKNERFLIICTPGFVIGFHTLGWNVGSTVTAFFLEGDFASHVAWTKLIISLVCLANTIKAIITVIRENNGYEVSSSGNHANDGSDAV